MTSTRFSFSSVRLPGWPIAVPLLVFAAYGLWSLPGLLVDWRPSLAALPMIGAWLAIAVAPLALAARGRYRAAIVAAVIGGVALRVAIALLADGRYPPGDAHLYPPLADGLRFQGRLAIVDPSMGVETRALYPPFYPILLAGWSMIFDRATWSLTLLTTLTDLGTAYLVVRLGRMLDRRRTGMAAAWLYLVWPSVLYSVPVAQKESLVVLLALALAVQWVGFARGNARGWSAGIAIGVTTAVLALTQPGEFPIGGLFGIVALGVGWRRLARVVAAAAIAAVVVMTPWWVRNALVFGSFVPLTSAGGYGFWVGNNPDANGHWMPPPRRLIGLAEIPFGKAAAHIAVEWIETHPLGFVRVTIAKVLRAWGLAEFGAMRFRMMKPAPLLGVTSGLFALSQFVHFALLGVAAWGTRIRRTPGAVTLLLLVFAGIVQTLCFGAFFEFGERHRDFLTPFLLMLGLWGLREPRTAGAE